MLTDWMPNRDFLIDWPGLSRQKRDVWYAYLKGAPASDGQPHRVLHSPQSAYQDLEARMNELYQLKTRLHTAP